MNIKVNKETLAKVENELAYNKPFGSASHIIDCAWERYRYRLGVASAHFAAAAPLSAALEAADPDQRYTFLGDPTVRGAINLAVSSTLHGSPHNDLDETNALFELAIERLQRHCPIPPLHSPDSPPARLGSGPRHAWIFAEDESIGHTMLRRLFQQHLGTSGLKLRSASPGAVAVLQKGAQLLEELLPSLSASVLSHVHLVALVDHPPGFLSLTNPWIPGTVIFAEEALRTPWEAAEYLLHEALHVKFVDLEQSYSLWGRGVAEPQYVEPPWHRIIPGKADQPVWKIARCLTVAHVYVGLGLFFSTIQHRSDLVERFGPLAGLNPIVSARRSLDRAHYLADAMTSAPQQLGPAGIRFAGWLKQVLMVLDPNPPGDGSDLRLLLDRFARETDQIGSALLAESAEGESPQHPALIWRVLQSEVTSLAELSRTLGLPAPWVSAWDGSVPAETSASPDELARKWWSVRTLISNSIVDFADQTAVLPRDRPEHTVEHAVRDMFQATATEMNALIEQTRPRAVQRVV